MDESRIGAKGRTTLPRAVREALSLQPGDRVRYFVEGNTVRIVPARPLRRLFGVLQYDGPAVELGDMERAIAEGATGS